MKFAIIIMLNIILLTTAYTQEPTIVATPADTFWSNLQSLCGKAFAGRVDHAPLGDTSFSNKALVMHVRQCEPDRIYIPFHVGENRSRTWVLTRTAEGILLKHDHRHEDGSEDQITQYGGKTSNIGSLNAQVFPADAHTVSILPAAFGNVWMIEMVPGEFFAYSLRRMGTDRFFRVVFDLSTAIAAPPTPWGWK